MKHFVLLHNLIMMTQANILNSVHPWFKTEIADLQFELLCMVHAYEQKGKLTDYQTKKLEALINSLEPPTT